ncbi:MAG: hypothetical protein RLZZ200_573 [Pseudomonadota bacterium]|jgi:PAS domain S-box-containing protein
MSIWEAMKRISARPVQMALLVSLLLLGMTSWNAWQLRQDARTRAAEEVLGVLDQLASALDGRFRDNAGFLLQVAGAAADYPDKPEAEQAEFQSLARRELNRHPGILRLFLTDRAGQQIYNSGFDASRVRLPFMGRYPLFSRARNGESLVFQGPQQANLDSQNVIFMARPVRGSGGEFQGIVGLVVPTSGLSDRLQDVSRAANQQVLLLTDEMNVVREGLPADRGAAAGPVEGVAAQLSSQREARPEANRHVWQTPGTAGTSDDLHAAARIGEFPYWLLASRAGRTTDATWRRNALITGVATGVAVLLILAGAVSLTRQRARLQDRIREATSELTASEERLREVAARSESILEALPDGLLVTDANGKILSLNRSIESMFGYTREALLGRSVDQLIPDRFRAGHGGKVESFMGQKGQIQKRSHMAFRALARDGREFPVDLGLNLRTEGDGKEVICTIRDISQRVAAEEKLRAVQADYQKLFEQSPEGTLILGDIETGTIADCNAAALRMFGIRSGREGLVGKTILDLSPERQPDGRLSTEAMQALRDNVASEGGMWHEWQHRCPDGRLIDVEVTTSATIYRGNRAALAMMRDVTERKAVERRLVRSEAMLARAQSIAKIGSFEFDAATGKYVSSAETDRLFGVSDQTTTSLAQWFERVHPDDRERVAEAWTATLRGAAYDQTYRIVVGGETLWVRSIAEVETASDGSIRRISGAVQDITAAQRNASW